MSLEPFFVVVLPPLAFCAPSLAEGSGFGCPGAHRKALFHPAVTRLFSFSGCDAGAAQSRIYPVLH